MRFPYPTKNRFFQLKDPEPLNGIKGVNVTAPEENTAIGELSGGQNVFTDTTGSPYARPGSVILGGSFSQYGTQGGFVFRDNEQRVSVVGVAHGVIYSFDGTTFVPLSGAPTLSTTNPVNGVFFPDVDKYYLTDQTNDIVEFDQSSGLTATSKSSMQKCNYLGYNDHHLYFLGIPGNPNILSLSDEGEITNNSTSQTVAQGFLLGMASLDVYNAVVVTDQVAYRVQGSISAYDNAGDLGWFPGTFISIGRSRCVASRSILGMNNTVYWLGLDEFNVAEVYRCDGQQIFPIGWPKLKTYLRNINAAELSSACAIQYGMYAKFAVPSEGTGYNDTELILDTARSLTYTEDSAYGPPQVVWEAQHLPGYGIAQYASWHTSSQDYILGFDSQNGQIHRTGVGTYDELPLENSLPDAAATGSAVQLTNNSESNNTAYYLSYNSATNTSYDNIAQSFVATNSGVVDSISLFIAAGYYSDGMGFSGTFFDPPVSGTDTVTLIIYSDSGGNPGTTLKTVVVSSFDSTWQTVNKHTIAVSSGPTLTAGTTYWISASTNLSNPGGGVDGAIAVYGTSNISTTLGWKSHAGSTWTAISGEMGYEVYQTVTIGALSLTSTTPVDQPFTFTSDLFITGMSFIVQSNSTTNVASLTVYSDSSGSPGTALGTIPILTQPLTSSTAGLITFEYLSPVDVPAGTYHFVLSLSTGTLGISKTTSLVFPLPYQQEISTVWTPSTVNIATILTSAQNIDAWYTLTSSFEQPNVLKRITRHMINATSVNGVTLMIGIGSQGRNSVFIEVPVTISSGITVWGSESGSNPPNVLIWAAPGDTPTLNNIWSSSVPVVQYTAFASWYFTPGRYLTVRFRAVSQSDWRINAYTPTITAIPSTLS